jgi:hypothetical protein
LFLFILGVEVGEISARFAHEVGDNGYLRLANVRIPRNQMLMKLAYVCNRIKNVLNKTDLF